MQANRVKQILREGGLALGTYRGGIADPQIVEIIGHAGFDAAFIDMEHTSFDLRDVPAHGHGRRAGRHHADRPHAGFDPRSSSACSTWACRASRSAHQRRAGRARRP
jgi:hypothetical protein